MASGDFKPCRVPKYLSISLGILVVFWLIQSTGGFSLGIVQGDSMYPTLRSGDLIVILSLEGKWRSFVDIKEGDIVSAYVWENFGGRIFFCRVVKRVVKICPDCEDYSEHGGDTGLVVLWGDNKEASAFYVVSPQQIQGKVLYVIPRGGIILSGVIATLFCWLLLSKVWKNVMKR